MSVVDYNDVKRKGCVSQTASTDARQDAECVNAAAVAAAKFLAEGKSKAEITELLRLLNMLVCALRNYL